jgi:hypothetical protein
MRHLALPDEPGSRVFDTARELGADLSVITFGEDPEDAACSRWERCSFTLHDFVDTFAGMRCLTRLELAERVAELARDQTRVEADPLIIQSVWNRVAERAQPCFGIDQRMIEHGRWNARTNRRRPHAVRVADADSEEAGLRIGATDGDRCPFLQTVAAAASSVTPPGRLGVPLRGVTVVGKELTRDLTSPTSISSSVTIISLPSTRPAPSLTHRLLRHMRPPGVLLDQSSPTSLMRDAKSA